jgi:hypothetical protein
MAAPLTYHRFLLHVKGQEVFPTEKLKLEIILISFEGVAEAERRPAAS